MSSTPPISSHRTDADAMQFLSELWGFLRHRKKFWMLPVVLVLLVFGTLILLAGGSALAPFIYTLF
jgi:hypothetical protein